MQIIALEGLDKSGKATQTNMLKDYLKDKGYRIVTSDFHRYDTPTGNLIMKWLRKEWNVSQHTIELIMSADKQAQQDWFIQLSNMGIDFLILDRYTTSQMVYSIANQINPNWTHELQRYMRKPDLEIFIDIPAELSMQRKGKWGENDRYESDYKLLDYVRQLYLDMSKLAVDGTGTPEEVHQSIIKIVEKELL